ncbi:MAG: NUDIX hydrolase [Planctomycetes bacterium]|nr:NUDIX hydrolase [Planctomycetota bacterium]
MNESDAPRPWPLVAREYGPDLMICRVRFDTLTNPRTQADLKRTVLETPTWCNVVALTRERHLVVVRQFRFGNSGVTIEIPGGVVDRGEEHGAAARRELREEAGYTSSKWTYLGCVEPNPAFHDNLCHHWLAEDCERTHEQELDGGEDIAIDTLSFDAVRARIANGEIRHALVLTALAHVLDLRTHARA